MNTKETKKILAYLREAYPNGKAGGENTVRLWQDLLEPYDYAVAWIAAKHVVRTWQGYTMPPISVLIDAISLILGRDNTPIEDWRIIQKAAKRGTVITQSEFDDFPERVKRFLGGVSALRDLAMMPPDQLANEEARFLKSASGIDSNIKAQRYIPEELRDRLENLTKAIEERNKDNEK